MGCPSGVVVIKGNLIGGGTAVGAAGEQLLGAILDIRRLILPGDVRGVYHVDVSTPDHLVVDLAALVAPVGAATFGRAGARYFAPTALMAATRIFWMTPPA